MAADNDWSKPKARAIPKEGYFTLQQGRYTPDVFPNTGVSWLHHHRQDQARHRSCNPRGTARASRRPSRRVRMRSAHCSCIICGGCCSISAPTHTSCIKASSIRISTVHRGRRRAVQGDGRRHHLRAARRISGGLEDERSGLHHVRPRTPVPQLPRIR